MLLLGVPIMVSEFVIGRHSQTSVAQSFFKMSGGKKGWKLMGLIPVIAGFLVLSYYAVVAGWTLYYAFLAGIDGFAGKTPDEIGTAFQSFCADPVNPLIWIAIILVINGLIDAFRAYSRYLFSPILPRTKSNFLHPQKQTDCQPSPYRNSPPIMIFRSDRLQCVLA